MDRRMDRRTDDVKPVYPAFNFVEVGGIMNSQNALHSLPKLWSVFCEFGGNDDHIIERFACNEPHLLLYIAVSFFASSTPGTLEKGEEYHETS